MEYAEQYSKPEARKRIGLQVLLGALILICHIKWVQPFIDWYINTAHCHQPYGYSGLSVLWYSLFVGLPLFIALIINFTVLPLGIKGLIEQQFPPKGVKVYKPTKILRGWHAKLKSFSCILIVLLLNLIPIWGYFQVDKMPMPDEDKLDYSVCQQQLTYDVNRWSLKGILKSININET